MATTTHLPARDVVAYINSVGGGITGGAKISRVQTASVTSRQNVENTREIGSTNFWEFYNQPTVDVSIDRQCVGDGIMQTALNSSYSAGVSTLKDLVFDGSGNLITKDIYLCGGDNTLSSPELKFGATSCFLSGVDFRFDVGGMATESWRFEASGMTSDTTIADPGTPSTVTSLTAASGYGGIRHSDIDVEIVGSGGSAITLRVQSVNFSAQVAREPFSELLSLGSGGVVGPFTRVATLPFTVTAAVELFPSTNINQITSYLGTINNPTQIGASTAQIKVTVKVNPAKVYRIYPCTLEDLSFNADAAGVGRLSLTARAFDMYL